MKYYLAARYSRREELLRYAWHLEELGHEVTSRWIRGEHEMPEIGDADTTDEAFNTVTDERRAEIGKRFALEDLDDLMKAECLIAFTEQPGQTKGRGRGGRHVELGFALALLSLRVSDSERGQWMNQVVVIGPRENVFCCLDGVFHFPDWTSYLLASHALVDRVRHLELQGAGDEMERMSAFFNDHPDVREKWIEWRCANAKAEAAK